MIGRLYVCPVVGTGTSEDPQRALIEDLAGIIASRQCIATVPTGVRRGQAVHAWTLVWCDAEDWSAVEGEPRCVALPTDDLDLPVPPEERSALRSVGAVTPAESHPSRRALIRNLLQKHYPTATIARAFPELEDSDA